MAVIKVETGRDIAAAPKRVFACIADFDKRPQWLPPNYSELTVERGGTGAGTIARYRLKVGPRERVYHMHVTEPRSGATLLEKDADSSMQVTWAVTPRGAESHVTVTGQWQGASGFGGFMERMFAPGGLRRVLDDALTRLAQFATNGAR
jgi:uncharacterized protein YndB with AHSA1/START domain